MKYQTQTHLELESSGLLPRSQNWARNRNTPVPQLPRQLADQGRYKVQNLFGT